MTDLNKLTEAVRGVFSGAQLRLVAHPEGVVDSDLPVPLEDLECLEIDLSAERISDVGESVADATDVLADIVDGQSDWMMVGMETRGSEQRGFFLARVYFVRALDGRDLEPELESWYAEPDGEEQYAYDDEDDLPAWSEDAEEWKRR